MATESSLLSDLQRLGVQPGDLLFVHSSYKSLGPVNGGAEAVVGALQSAVASDGLILMPSFNLTGSIEERSKNWDHQRTSSTVGWLTEHFRLMDETYRSNHYSHSVAARGKDAVAFVADQHRCEGMRSPWDLDPWGKTYGTHAPMTRAYEANGRVLMLGVDYETSTFVHYVETTVWNRRLAEDPDAGYPRIFRVKVGAYWESLGRLSRGYVGNAFCRLFSIREYVDTLVSEYKRAALLYTRKRSAT